MKIWPLYLFIVFSGLHFQASKLSALKWVILSGCWLKVDGSTNINNSSFAIPDYANPDTILVSRSSNQMVQLDGSISLPVQNFDCRNPIMTADLRKTLKVKEFPKVIVKLISINKYPDASMRQETTKGTVAIELAGVSKRFEVDYKVVLRKDFLSI